MLSTTCNASTGSIGSPTCMPRRSKRVPVVRTSKGRLQPRLRRLQRTSESARAIASFTTYRQRCARLDLATEREEAGRRFAPVRLRDLDQALVIPATLGIMLLVSVGVRFWLARRI